MYITFFISWVHTDIGELQDASTSTKQKPKEGENTQTIMMNGQEVIAYYSNLSVYIYYHILNCNIYG